MAKASNHTTHVVLEVGGDEYAGVMQFRYYPAEPATLGDPAAAESVGFVAWVPNGFRVICDNLKRDLDLAARNYADDSESREWLLESANSDLDRWEDDSMDMARLQDDTPALDSPWWHSR